MIIYLICFFLTTIFTYIAEKNFEKEKKRKGIIFSILAILQPVILAALRSSLVGSDVAGYVDNSFQKAFYYNNIFSYLENSEVETGYSILVYIISKISNDIHLFYFIYETIICFLIYYTLYKERKNTKMWLGMLVFLFVFYNATLSMVRQSIAIAFIFYSVYTMKNKKYIRTIILFLIALLFHNSTVLAIPIYIIILLDKVKIKYNIKIMIYIVTFCILLFIIFQYENIINYLAFDLKVLSTKYVKYLSNEHYINLKIDINYFDLVFRFIWIFLYYLYVEICKNKNSKEYYKYSIYVIFIFVEVACILLSSKITNVFRVGYYYGVTAMTLLIPKLIAVFKKNKTNQILATSLIISILFVYWFYSNILYRGSGTYPYMSDIISILNYIP